MLEPRRPIIRNNAPLKILANRFAEVSREMPEFYFCGNDATIEFTDSFGFTLMRDGRLQRVTVAIDSRDVGPVPSINETFAECAELVARFN